MANPQAENGHVDISNEVMDALISHRVSGEEMQCLLFIIRKTWGWKKKEDRIALSQFVKATGINKQSCHRAIKRLESKKMIAVIKKDYENINSYCFIKDFEVWKSSSKKITASSKKIKGVIKKDYQSSSKKMNTKDTITKDTITKEKIVATEIGLRLSTFLFSFLKERNNGHKPPDLNKWGIDIDKMIRVDSRDPNDIESVIRWCQEDDFWKNNILSAGKLRKQFDQLKLKMPKESKGRVAEWLLK
jgi:phage replication O-like protein O